MTTTSDLERSLQAIHSQNTGRPIRCLDCGVVFIGRSSAVDYFRHVASRHTHPSTER